MKKQKVADMKTGTLKTSMRARTKWIIHTLAFLLMFPFIMEHIRKFEIERTFATLAAYRRSHGGYPSHLSDAGIDSYFLPNDLQYSGGGDLFMFTFSCLGGYCTYDTSYKRWTRQGHG
jgi:hypothetical protein